MLLLVPHACTDRSKAMEENGLVTKAGFDATAKKGDRVEGIDRAPPREAAKRWLTENIPSSRRQWMKK